MPFVNLGQCCSFATTLAGGRQDWVLSEASAWANFALEQVSAAAGAAHAPREALAVSSTTSGGNRVQLPPDFAYPLALTLYQGSTSTGTLSNGTQSIPLRQRDAAYLDAQPEQFNGAVPAYYLLYNSWIELFPSPNSAYSLALRYIALQPTLVDSTATPNLTMRWHQAWIYKTAELLEASRNNVEGEAANRQRYLNYVSTLETDRGERQHDRRSMSLRFGSRRRAD